MREEIRCNAGTRVLHYHLDRIPRPCGRLETQRDAALGRRKFGRVGE